MRVLLVSPYDLGHQPFGLASPAAWLRQAGHVVTCVDVAIEPLSPEVVRAAEMIAFYLPMHTATRLAVSLIRKAREVNPAAQVVAYGLYAPLNAEYLREGGVQTVLGSESEAALVQLANGNVPASQELPRLAFQVPDRAQLPVLAAYPHLRVGADRRVVGYTEATRGCKHLCRHCPVVPVYQGQFRVVPVEVVLADIRQQVAAGAQHITFGDPDFWNGPTHALRIMDALHREFPALTYDATIKIEHLRQQRALLPRLRETGCLFVTSAVESLQDDVLTRLDKGHTRAEFLAVVEEFRQVGLTMVPTFIPFTPWTTVESYRDLLQTLAEQDLVDQVSPVQLALRLLLPAGSRLLELPETRAVCTGYDAPALLHRWAHPDPAIDQLAATAMRLVSRGQRENRPRRETFARLAELVQAPPPSLPRAARTTVPYLEEPWYC